MSSLDTLMAGSRSHRATICYLGVASLQRGAAFLTLPFFAASLAPRDYGQIAVLLAVFGLAVMLLPAGLEVAVFRGMFSHGSPQRQQEYVATLATGLFVGPLVLGAVAGLLISLGPPLFGVDPQYLGVYVATAGILTAATVAPLAMLRATERLGSFALLTLVPAAMQLGLRLLLVVFAHMGVRGWVVADFSAALLALLLSLGWQGRLLSLRRARREDLRAGLRIGLPLVPHLAAHWGLNLSDRLIIGAFSGSALLGIYSMGYQIAFAAGMAVTELNRSFMPRYGEAVRHAEARDLLAGHVNRQVLATVGIAAGASLMGPQLVHLFLPEAYGGAAALIPWVALGFMFLGFYFVPMNLISIVVGETSGLWVLTLCAAGVTIGANLLLVPHLGPTAAAINTAVGYFVLLVLMVRAARLRCLSVHVDLRPILVVVATALAVTGIGSFLSVRPGTGGLVAALACSTFVVSILTFGARSRPRQQLSSLLLMKSDIDA